jgi:hypothetical protein
MWDGVSWGGIPHSGTVQNNCVAPKLNRDMIDSVGGSASNFRRDSGPMTPDTSNG